MNLIRLIRYRFFLLAGLFPYFLGQTVAFNIQEELNEIICPECGFTVERDTFERLMKYASEAMRFGYHYRLVYEDDYRKEGRLSSRYALSPLGIALSFAAIAALSGVIGNISYDIIKKVIQKIKEKSSNPDDSSAKSYNILNNEEEFRVFTMYIEDFHNDLQNVIPEIAAAVIREMIVDKTLELEDLGADLKGEKDPVYYLLQASIQVRRKKKPHSTDFADFWKKIE